MQPLRNPRFPYPRYGAEFCTRRAITKGRRHVPAPSRPRGQAPRSSAPCAAAAVASAPAPAPCVHIHLTVAAALWVAAVVVSVFMGVVTAAERGWQVVSQSRRARKARPGLRPEIFCLASACAFPLGDPPSHGTGCPLLAMGTFWAGWLLWHAVPCIVGCLAAPTRCQ